MASLYPLPNYSDPDNRYNYVYSALEPTNRLEMKLRFDWNITATPRRTFGWRATTKMSRARAASGGAARSTLPTPAMRTNRGRSYSVQHRPGAEPDDDERGARDVQPPDARQLRTAILEASEGRARVDFVGFFPDQSPYVPLVHIHSWFGGQLGDFGRSRPRRAMRTMTSCCSPTS